MRMVSPDIDAEAPSATLTTRLSNPIRFEPLPSMASSAATDDADVPIDQDFSLFEHDSLS